MQLQGLAGAVAEAVVVESQASTVKLVRLIL
jgi:hypothetical protein